MDCRTQGFPVLHYLPEFAQFMSTKSVMPSPTRPLSPPSLFALNLSQQKLKKDFELDLEFCSSWNDTTCCITFTLQFMGLQELDMTLTELMGWSLYRDTQSIAFGELLNLQMYLQARKVMYT